MSLLDVFFRVLLSFLGSIPYPILYRAGKLLALLMRIFPNKHKNITAVTKVKGIALVINFLSPDLKDLSNSKIRVIECLIE